MHLGILASVNVAFSVVFAIFLVATLVLLVLTIRFIVAKGRSDREAFEATKPAQAAEDRTQT